MGFVARTVVCLNEPNKINPQGSQADWGEQGKILKKCFVTRPNSVSVGSGQSSCHQVTGSVPSWNVLVLSSQCLHVECSVWYLTFVKVVALAHGSETVEVETIDESESEKRRGVDRKKTPTPPPPPNPSFWYCT